MQVKILKSNYALDDCKAIISLYQVSKSLGEFEPFFYSKGIIRYVFNSMLYTKTSYK